MPHRRERAGLRCDAQDPFALLTLPGRDLSASSLLGGVGGHPNPAARSQVPSARGQLRGWPIPARLHPARQRRFRERGRYRAERSGDEAAAAGVCAGTDRQRHHGGADPVSAHRDAPCWGCAVRGGCAVLCRGCAGDVLCCAGDVLGSLCWASPAGPRSPCSLGVCGGRWPRWGHGGTAPCGCGRRARSAALAERDQLRLFHGYRAAPGCHRPCVKAPGLPKTVGISKHWGSPSSSGDPKDTGKSLGLTEPPK